MYDEKPSSERCCRPYASCCGFIPLSVCSIIVGLLGVAGILWNTVIRGQAWDYAEVGDVCAAAVGISQDKSQSDVEDLMKVFQMLMIATVILAALASALLTMTGLVDLIGCIGLGIRLGYLSFLVQVVSFIVGMYQGIQMIVGENAVYEQSICCEIARNEGEGKAKDMCYKDGEFKTEDWGEVIKWGGVIAVGMEVILTPLVLSLIYSHVCLMIDDKKIREENMNGGDGGVMAI